MIIRSLGKIDIPAEEKQENWEKTKALLNENGCNSNVSGRCNYIVYCVDGEAKICTAKEAKKRGVLDGWGWTEIVFRNFHLREFTYKKEAIACYNKLVTIGFKNDGWNW